MPSGAAYMFGYININKKSGGGKGGAHKRAGRKVVKTLANSYINIIFEFANSNYFSRVLVNLRTDY